jgi:hypothetical protein
MDAVIYTETSLSIYDLGHPLEDSSLLLITTIAQSSAYVKFLPVQRMRLTPLLAGSTNTNNLNSPIEAAATAGADSSPLYNLFLLDPGLFILRCFGMEPILRPLSYYLCQSTFLYNGNNRKS